MSARVHPHRITVREQNYPTLGGVRFDVWGRYPDGDDDLISGLHPTRDAAERVADRNRCEAMLSALGDALSHIAAATTLGTAFAGRLAVHLTGDQWAEMRRRNADDWDSPREACASHDFIDANDVMEEAFTRTVGRPSVLGSAVEAGTATEAEADADCRLWNDAWSWAKVQHLTEGAS